MTKKEAKKRLEYLRGEIEAERISYSEIAELQSLAKYIDRGDVLLLEWAGVPEFPKEKKEKETKRFKSNLEPERLRAIKIMEYIASTMGDEDMFDGEKWYEIEDEIYFMLTTD